MTSQQAIPPTGPAETVLAHNPRFMPRVAVAAAIVVLGFRFFQFISKYSVNILFMDQWDLLTPFFHGTPRFAQLFFMQYASHREGLGMIADKLLYPVTSWSVRAESFMMGGCVFCAMLLALLLKRRLFGPVSYSDAAIPLLFLNLTQCATLVDTPEPAYFCFPLLLVMLYCLALLVRNTWLRYALVLSLNFLLIYTGNGIFMGVVTIGLFALDCYWSLRAGVAARVALPFSALLIAGMSLGSFFIHFIFSAAADRFVFPYHPLSWYPWFVALMFAQFVAPPRPVALATVIGAAILLMALAILTLHLYRLLMRQGPSADASLVGGVLLSYSLLFSAGAAVGRVYLGMPEAAQTSRYTTLLIPALLAVYFYLLALPSERTRKLALLLMVVTLIPPELVERTSCHRIADGKRAWAACYIRAEDIQYCDRTTHFVIFPYPERTGLKQKLEYLKQRRLNLFADQAR